MMEYYAIERSWASGAKVIGTERFERKKQAQAWMIDLRKRYGRREQVAHRVVRVTETRLQGYRGEEVEWENDTA